MKKLSDKQQRERKFMLFLPVLTLPFLCLAFWALGGGKGKISLEKEFERGLNMSLPEARVDSGILDKLESYKEADKKALRLREQRRMDPFAAVSEPVSGPISDPVAIESEQILSISSEIGLSLEETENSVRKKLAELDRLVAGKGVEPDVDSSFDRVESMNLNPVRSEELELNRLETMMATVVNPEMEDPEMKRIDSMLDKLLDVQHPQRVQERMKKFREESDLNRYTVSINSDEGLNSVVGMRDEPYLEGKSNGFFTLEEKVFSSFSEIKPAISARVTTDQVIVDGASIELELEQPVFIRGEKLPKGTTMTGICSLDGERLLIQVSTIRSGNLIIPVNLEAMDLDGLSGIRIPNAITRSAVKQGSSDGIQSMNMMTLSNSWETQASMAGMETVKGIFSRKAKLIKVTVKAGHPLLMVDQSNQ